MVLPSGASEVLRLPFFLYPCHIVLVRVLLDELVNPDTIFVQLRLRRSCETASSGCGDI